MTRAKWVVALGIPVGTVLWDQYGTKVTGWVSDKLNHAIHVSPLPNSVKDWYTPSKITGVTIASNVFVKACGNHSPIINGIEKTTIGLTYYVPGTVAYEFTTNTLPTWIDSTTNQVISVVIGVAAGAFVGNKFQYHCGTSLDWGCRQTDKKVALVVGIFTTVFSKLMGKSHAEELPAQTEEEDSQLVGLCFEETNPEVQQD